jgi:hypothetical protein
MLRPPFNQGLDNERAMNIEEIIQKIHKDFALISA